eukprot:3508820-Prymnesium_polylepis.1
MFPDVLHFSLFVLAHAVRWVWTEAAWAKAASAMLAPLARVFQSTSRPRAAYQLMADGRCCRQR